MFAVETADFNGEAFADHLYQSDLNPVIEAFRERSIFLLDYSHLNSVITYGENF